MIWTVYTVGQLREVLKDLPADDRVRMGTKGVDVVIREGVVELLQSFYNKQHFAEQGQKLDMVYND